MASLQKPDKDSLKNQDELLAVLVSFYDNIRAALGLRMPDTVPVLKAATASTHAALRNTVGDPSGQAGPRVCIVVGRSAVLDGGQGIYAWDATSTALDDDVGVIQPLALGGKPGRWRKGAF